MGDKKICVIALLGFILAIAAYSLAFSPDISFQIVENNTDIGYPNGTGERFYNTVYYANSSPIAIMLKAHAIGVNQDMDFNLSINNTVIQDVDHRTAVGAGIHEHESIYAIIPRGSNYSVRNSTDITQVEWREYPILSGKNGTLSINQTNIYQNTSGGGGISFNGSAVDMNGSSFYNGSQQTGTFNHSNLTRLNSSASGHYQDSTFNMSGYNISQSYDYNGYDLVHVQQNNTPFVRTTFDSGNNEAKFLSSTFENRNFFIQQTFSNESTARYNGFGAWKFGYNSTPNRIYSLKSGELIYAFFAGGYQSEWEDLNSSGVTNIALANMSGGVAGLLFYTGTTNWNTSSTPTKACLYSQKRMKAGLNLVCVDEDGNFTIPSLSGSGNNFVCVDASGKLYRGSGGC